MPIAKPYLVCSFWDGKAYGKTENEGGANPRLAQVDSRSFFVIITMMAMVRIDTGRAITSGST